MNSETMINGEMVLVGIVVLLIIVAVVSAIAQTLGSRDKRTKRGNVEHIEFVGNIPIFKTRLHHKKLEVKTCETPLNGEMTFCGFGK